MELEHSKFYTLVNSCNHVFSSNNFYVYQLRDPEDILPFYIGKGRDNRAWKHVLLRNNEKERVCNPHKINKINKIIDQGRSVQVEILETFQYEQSAYEIELTLIEKYGRQVDGSGVLTNIMKGGEGASRNGIPVNQYDLCGNLIASFSSAKEAARLCGFKHYSPISSCCRKRERSYKGFMWSYSCHDLDFSNYKIKPVYQWSLEGKLLNTYINISAAAKDVGCDPSTIRGCLTHKSNTALKCVWSHTDKFPGVRKSRKVRKVCHLNSGITYASVTEAANALNLPIQRICACCNGKIKHVKGNKFLYSDQ